MIRVETEEDSLLEAARMLTRRASATRSAAERILCWKLCAACDASLLELLCREEDEARPRELE